MRFIPTQKQKKWIDSKIESGDYANAGEVLQDLVCEQMRREQKLQELRNLIDEGARGPFVPFDIEQIIQEAEEEREAEEAEIGQDKSQSE